jgi:hypothetical protein
MRNRNFISNDQLMASKNQQKTNKHAVLEENSDNYGMNLNFQCFLRKNAIGQNVSITFFTQDNMSLNVYKHSLVKEYADTFGIIQSFTKDYSTTNDFITSSRQHYTNTNGIIQFLVKYNANTFGPTGFFGKNNTTSLLSSEYYKNKIK